MDDAVGLDNLSGFKMKLTFIQIGIKSNTVPRRTEMRLTHVSPRHPRGAFNAAASDGA
jgi:hypothetical protein